MNVTTIGRTRKPAGFGLIEIMIAMALGIVIILGITTLFADTSKSLDRVDRSGRLIENALFALELLASELSLAGYWGGASYPVDAETQIFVAGEVPSSVPSGLSWDVATEVPAACLGTGRIISGTADNAKAELAFAMEYPLFSALGSSLNSEVAAGICGVGAIAPASSNSDYFVIRRAGSCATGAPPKPAVNRCRPLGDYYHLQANGCYSENLGLSGGELKLLKVNNANVASQLSYTGFDCSTMAPVYRLVSRIYYVDNNDTMTRLYLDNTGGALGFQTETLVEGVELLRFEWFIDRSGDGQYDFVSRSPSASDWSKIIGVKIWTVVRSSVAEPDYIDDAVYSIAGEPWAVPTDKSSYRRVIQSRMVDITNMGGSG